MSQEQDFDLAGWWNKQFFAGKELYKLQETGELMLLQSSNIKERIIATISSENADVVLKNLLEKYDEASSKVKEVEVEWLAADDKLKMTDRVAHLKEYLEQVNGLGDLKKLALLVHDWEHTLYALSQENYNNKLKLAQMAEELAGSDQWKETTQAFRDIADKWKECGHVDKNRNDKLWNRIEAARKAFHERKRLHNVEEEKDMLHNLDLKIDLVEQAEAIAKSEDWKKTTETYQRLTEEWKTIGHTLNKKNEELWQRFIAAKSAFFDKKREHYNKIQTEQELSYAAKLELVEKAEALKDSTEWNATTQALAGLMEEWKKTGHVPNEKGEGLWKRFMGAQEHFFETKKQHYDGQRAALENNYTLKKALYDRAEQLKHSNHWGETTAEMVALLEEWKKIGPVPRSHGDKLWEDFNAARKYFFNRKDVYRDQRKQFAESQKAVRAQQAKDSIGKLREELKEEEEKLADFKNGIENITPGKKAAELRAHLEKLIAEGEHKIKRLQEKYAQAQKDIGVAEVKNDAAAAQ